MAGTKGEVETLVASLQARLRRGIGMAPRPGFADMVIQQRLAEFQADVDALTVQSAALPRENATRTPAETAAVTSAVTAVMHVPAPRTVNATQTVSVVGAVTATLAP